VGGRGDFKRPLKMPKSVPAVRRVVQDWIISDDGYKAVQVLFPNGPAGHEDDPRWKDFVKLVHRQRVGMDENEIPEGRAEIFAALVVIMVLYMAL
jgi:hypothetical protein